MVAVVRDRLFISKNLAGVVLCCAVPCTVSVYVKTAVSPAGNQVRDTVLVRMSALQIRIMFAIENGRMRCCNECCEVSELLADGVVCSQDGRASGRT
jgi:hypothetical protein